MVPETASKPAESDIIALDVFNGSYIAEPKMAEVCWPAIRGIQDLLTAA